MDRLRETITSELDFLSRFRIRGNASESLNSHDLYFGQIDLSDVVTNIFREPEVPIRPSCNAKQIAVGRWRRKLRDCTIYGNPLLLGLIGAGSLPGLMSIFTCFTPSQKSPPRWSRRMQMIRQGC